MRAADRPQARQRARGGLRLPEDLVLAGGREASRKFIRESKCFCTYECFLTINILFNPRMMPAVLKEWSSLKMRKLWRRLTGKQPQHASLATCGSKTAHAAADAA